MIAKSKLSFAEQLFICFAFIGSMLAVRIFYAGSFRFLFLVWNLFLAWIPYAVSLLLASAKGNRKFMNAAICCMWLLFFPNALYIVTDIIHLRSQGNIPLWYDAVLLFTCSLAGLAMAFASLVNIQRFIQRTFPRLSTPAGSFIAIAFLFVGAFGVYLGRFQRWNSWDIINDPFALAEDILANFISPAEHIRTWAVTLLLTGLYSVCWFFTGSYMLQKASLKNEG